MICPTCQQLFVPAPKDKTTGQHGGGPLARYCTKTCRNRSASKRRQKRLKASIFKYLGSVCVECGFDDPRALQIDHINGNGYTERRGRDHRRIMGLAYNAHVLKQLEAGSANYQILCANHNWIKRAKNHEHRKRI